MTTVASDTTTPVVRPATRADLLTVFRIEQSAFPQPWPYSVFERYLDEPGFLVAESRAGPCPEAASGDRNCVVGYVVADVVADHGQRLGHVKDIAVAERRRGEGVGRRLLGRALTVLAGRGVTATKLEVREGNDSALALYRSFGFVHRGTLSNYYSNGEDALVMIRELDRPATS
ncbi:MAG: GNAT family N-acetyltransferase [Haloarculaceae archaeon]